MSGGGIASGPVSFMKGYDAFAGVIKSGGKTRRAAKMVILDADHPDVLDFIDSKMLEEKKAWALIEQGYDPSFTGEAYGSVFFQNANHSVRVTDEFMHAVETDGEWTTHAVLDGAPVDTLSARDIFRRMADAAWICGDPGIQYDTTINDWHTSANTDRIYASNPCSEYMFLNDTACNLASLNLMKFVEEDGEFDVEDYRYAARLTITAQEILVDNASYPTPRIEENSHKFRPLGLGYANLGALLMSRGLAYDSRRGSRLRGGPHRDHARRGLPAVRRDRSRSRRAVPRVRRESRSLPARHRQAPRRGLPALTKSAVPAGRPRRRPGVVFDEALELGKEYGYRNAQVTVLAPTGTIAFMMDCDTTGIEPDIALIKYKKLVGEGFLKIVNQTVPAALRKLGYSPDEVEAHPRLHQRARDDRGRARPQAGAPVGLRLRVQAGQRRALDPLHGPRPDDGGGPAVHLAARSARPSTCPRPPRPRRSSRSTSRAGSWASRRSRSTATAASAASRCQHRQEEGRGLRRAAGGHRRSCSSSSRTRTVEAGKPHRRRLPAERTAVTHKFDIAGHEGYITVGLYPDGQPGEIFLKMAKEGSTVSGLMDTLRDDGLGGAPVRRAAPRPGQQVRPRPVRAGGFTGNPRDPDRQVARRLHLPLARLAVPVGRRQGRPRADRSSSSTSADAPASAASARRLDLVRRTGPRRRLSAPAPSRSPSPRPSSPPTSRRPRRCAIEPGAEGRDGRARLPGHRRRASNGHANGHSNGHANGNAPKATNGGGITLNLGGTRSPSPPRPTPRRAWIAARSWFATALATSASTAAPPAAAAEQNPRDLPDYAPPMTGRSSRT